jgi:hypothetical protein
MCIKHHTVIHECQEENVNPNPAARFLLCRADHARMVWGDAGWLALTSHTTA